MTLYTFILSNFSKNGLNIFGSTIFGPNVFIDEYGYLHHSKRLENVTIGKFCSIAEGLYCMPHEHNFKNYFNYKFDDFYSPFFNKYYRLDNPDILKPIIIGNDVCIGCNVTILGSITIEDGSIIVADSVVTENIPPYTIYGGVPAKFIKNKIISDERIKQIESIIKNYSCEL